MKLVVSGSAVDLLALAGSAVGSLLFTLAGMLAEQAALHDVSTGAVVLGGWEAGMGALALLVGTYLLGYREFWPRLRHLRG